MEAARGERAEFLLSLPDNRTYQTLTRLFGWETLAETSWYGLDVPPAIASGAEVRELDGPTTGERWTVPYADPRYRHWRSLRDPYDVVSVGGLEVVYRVLPGEILLLLDAFRRESGTDAGKALQDLARARGCATLSLTGAHAARLEIALDDLRPGHEPALRLCAHPLKGSIPPLSLSLLMCHAC
jgi:hypothetical protein